MHSVNWYDCVKWCNARSEREGRPAAYLVGVSAYKTGQSDSVVRNPVAGYRLPTDLEWEYAARGGATGHRFPWSDSDEIQHARANYFGTRYFAYDTSPTWNYHPSLDGQETPKTSPAGSFDSNGYRLLDMAGNVMEWCFNWHSSYLNVARIACGGSWITYANNCRVGDRSMNLPDNALDFIGFRTVLSPAQ